MRATIIQQSTREGELFPRRCSITSEGMESGFCIQDGQAYIKNDDSLLEWWLLEHTTYSNKEEAYEDGYYYWTEWELDTDDRAFDKEGREYLWYEKHQAWEII